MPTRARMSHTFLAMLVAFWATQITYVYRLVHIMIQVTLQAESDLRNHAGRIEGRRSAMQDAIVVRDRLPLAAVAAAWAARGCREDLADERVGEVLIAQWSLRR